MLTMTTTVAARLSELFQEEFGIGPLIAWDMAERVAEVLEQDHRLLSEVLRDIIVEVSGE